MIEKYRSNMNYMDAVIQITNCIKQCFHPHVESLKQLDVQQIQFS